MSETRDERGLADEQARCCPGGWAGGHTYWCVNAPANAPASDEQGALCPDCGHRVKWHHDERGCDYHGAGPHACRCAQTSDAVVERIVAERLAIIPAQREAFISSPSLDPAWIAGWHAAIDHATYMSTRPGKPHQSALEAPSGDEQAARRLRAHRAAERLRDEVAAANPNGLVFHEDDESASGAREGGKA